MANTVVRAIAIALLLACCAGGAFALGRALRSSPPRTASAEPFTPAQLRLPVVAALSAQPGMPPLARR